MTTEAQTATSGEIANRAPRYLAVGHLTLDLADVTAEQGALGGTVLFAAKTAASLDWHAGVATCTPPSGTPHESLHTLHVMHPCAPHREHASDTIFAQHYAADGRRQQVLLSRAPALGPAAIRPTWHEVEILHIGPVLDEVSEATVAMVRAAFVGLTPQGFMREAPIGRRIRPKAPDVPQPLLDRAQGIVVSTEDIAADPDWPARTACPGRWVAVTDGPRGADLLWKGRRIHQPAFPTESVDPTGAGDVFAAALFIRMASGSPPEDALRFAAAAGAWSVAHHADDPRVTPTPAEVRSVLARAGSRDGPSS